MDSEGRSTSQWNQYVRPLSFVQIATSTGEHIVSGQNLNAWKSALTFKDGESCMLIFIKVRTSTRILTILMAAPHQPINLLTDYAPQLEILCKIESLGGSAGYEANPDAFGNFVSALDPFDSDVWTKTINELAENATELDAQALRAKLQAEFDLQHSDPKLAQKQRITDIIKGIESLGGSIGFQKFTVNLQTVSSQSDDQETATSPETQVAADEWPHCYASGFVRRALLITELDIFANQHSGSGHAWGPALGVGSLQGALFYSSFDADSFSFENVSVGARASMRLNGVITSFFMGALIGVSKGFSFEGNWNW